MLSDSQNNTMSRSPKKPLTSYDNFTADPPSDLVILPTTQLEQTVPQATMLMSPPPEETLRAHTPRARSSLSTSVERGSSSGVAFRVGFTGRVISNTLAGKRKRSGLPTSSSITSLVEDGSVQQHFFGPSKVSLDATPNPKPRKQSKRVSFVPNRESIPQPTTPTKSSFTRASSSPSKKSLLASPHAHNPNADYIPPAPSLSREHTSSRRRSATPLPHYEPPLERFTPPREVICTPIAAMHTPKARSHKGKMIAKGSGASKKLVLQIKKEFPEDIDLSAPLPPPSPTDDPLLLRGPMSSHRRRPRATSHPLQTPVYSRDTPPMASTSPIRSTDMDGTRLMDLNFDSVMDMGSEDAMNDIPPFDFSAGADDWSDDEHQSEQTFDQAGDFTGKFKVVAVPTKADPPSSTTRGRMEAWGRPSSPFPRVSSGLDTHEEVVEESRSTPIKSPSFTQRHPSPSPPAAGPSSVIDLFSPTRRVLRSPGLPLRPSPTPVRPNSPLPPSDEEPTSPEDEHQPSGPFDFDAIEDQHDSDDDLYEDHIVPIHDTSIDSVALEDFIDDPLPEGTDQAEASFDEQFIPNAPLSLTEGSLSLHLETLSQPTTGRSSTPTGPSDTFSESAEPITLDASETEEYRSSQVEAAETKADTSEDEDEDEVSVVRELSHPPDFGEDDAVADHVTESLAKFNIFSSPNPFDVRSPSEALHASQFSNQRPHGSLVAERSKMYEQRPADAFTPFALQDDDDDELEGMDAKTIKITSEDPRAAARAAAILRLHKYDYLEHPSPRDRRHSAVGLYSVLRKARRKSTLDGGVTKSSSALKRRQTLGGMIGDKVVIPGSPLMTLPQLLHEAERSLHIEDRSPSGSQFMPLSPSNKTPAREPSLYESVLRAKINLAPATTPLGPRPWSKDDWKKLDSCYTDERLTAAEQAGMVAGEMVSADEVDLEVVVDRFIELHGGEMAVVLLGTSWTREDLLKRARALQRKQRSGHIAPPTPSRSGSVLSNDTGTAPYQRFMSSMSPETSTHASDITAAEDAYPGSPSPQTVKYASLMDEALEISSTPHADIHYVSSYTAGSRSVPPSSIATRVKGFLFSYLPYMNKGKPTPAPLKAANSHVGLPIPPPDLFLRPRPPITTPASKLAPKPAHPKELVQLHPAPPPERPSMIPRSTSKNPPWAVELNHVSPPPEDKSMRSSTSSIRGRRDSNASVKDLVKSFETLEKHAERPRSELRRRKSIEEWNASARRNGPQKQIWKP